MAYNKINKIATHIQIIQDAINNKKNLAIFVGAGISKNSDVPLWSEIINIFSKELKMGDAAPSDYLKIAQCYYETHPIKYKKILNEKLNKNWDTNSITKFLFREYKPKYFITTNYDCILEKTADELKNNIYKVVCKNEDIPKIKDNAIIKMHGDFNNKNIILKESDYTDYSSEFKLVETFIKSVFATSIILFIGFSADDPNVNQIYQWVKDILKENKQPSYLLLCDEIKNHKKNKIIKKYLENKDIYTLNYHELINVINKFYTTYPINKTMESEIETLQYEKGKELYKFLYFIKNYNVEPIVSINSKIDIINTFNVIDFDDICKYLFEDDFARYNQFDKKIILYNAKFKGFIEDLQNSKNNTLFKKFKEFLLSNNVNSIEYRLGQEPLEVNIENI